MFSRDQKVRVKETGEYGRIDEVDQDSLGYTYFVILSKYSNTDYLPEECMGWYDQDDLEAAE
jgi:hypothetical protein